MPERWIESDPTLRVSSRPCFESWSGRARVFLSYRHVQPDEQIARTLEQALTKAHHAVFMDTGIESDSEWVRAIEALIQRVLPERRHTVRRSIRRASRR